MRKSIKELGLCFFLAAALTACSGGGGGGSSCISNEECSETEFCKFETGSCSSGGKCADIPTACPQEDAPVCSCENLSFFSECWANAAAQSVKAAGNCP